MTVASLTVAAYVGLAVAMEALLVIEQQLDSLDELLGDGVQEGVLRVDLEVDQQPDHLEVLVVDGHEEGRASQRVHAVYVDLVVVVLEHPATGRPAT